ncbi:MAG: MAPEG family protein [Pseudomonadales bacterium]
MTMALWVLFAAVLMPIVCAGIAKVGSADDSYDNASPRDWLARRTGYQARANSAQANSWEALGCYLAGLAAAHLGGVDAGLVASLASLFLLARVAYVICYVSNLATLRSVCWIAGFAACLGLIALGALGA